MTRRWTAVPILCIVLLLFASAVSAEETGSSADGRTTLRASTAAEGSSLVQAAGNAPTVAGQPSWVGLLVLIVGGLLAGLWLVIGVLSIFRAIGDTPHLSTAELPPYPSRSRRDEVAPAEWL